MTASCCLLYLAGVSLEGGRGAWSLELNQARLWFGALRHCRPVDVCESGAVPAEGPHPWEGHRGVVTLPRMGQGSQQVLIGQ